jgi:1,4-alpha-glucan branching enzyme
MPMSDLKVGEPARGTLREVTFALDNRRVAGAKWVALVGPFNRWDNAAHQMALEPDGWWRIVVTLAPGEYPYLFLVDGHPVNDPTDDGRVLSDWGGQYSLRRVG